MSKKKFKDLKIGDKFEVWGDQDLNYSYPKICQCVKIGEQTGQEIDGINFTMNPEDEVFLPSETKQPKGLETESGYVFGPLTTTQEIKPLKTTGTTKNEPK